MIRILAPEEAKKIAAGEVIDRPAALARELIDNALDAGAGHIELLIEEGGIKKLELIDDGCGMDKEDLSLCIRTHATSKIQSVDDLSRFTTLGFRGEALAAAAAVARLEIVTSTDGAEAWQLVTVPYNVTQTRRTRGTSVRTFGLFDSIPARKRFLKRESGEASLCRQIFTEKALAFPDISFRFVQDGLLKLNIIRAETEEKTIPALQKRFGELILDPHEKQFLHTVETGGKGFTVTIVFGGPELYRKDRRQQYIYANKRRIQDFALMQALEFGLAGFFPNGTHPLGAVFVEIDPAMADFNIHPAKREVRFADPGAIHHSITAALRSNLHTSTLAAQALLETTGDFVSLPFIHETMPQERYTAEKKAVYSALKQVQPGTNNNKIHNKKTQDTVRFAGRVFDLFILVEWGDNLYLIDQHAAHERLLYDQFLSGAVVTQELLVPIPFTTDNEETDSFLREKKDALAGLGIILANESHGSWRIEALPSLWKTADSETVETILALQSTKENLAESWASLACRSAIKDGDFLDDEAALNLAQAALALAGEPAQLPRCPHGRPLWTVLSREDLFRAVRRKE